MPSSTFLCAVSIVELLTSFQNISEAKPQIFSKPLFSPIKHDLIVPVFVILILDINSISNFFSMDLDYMFSIVTNYVLGTEPHTDAKKFRNKFV